MILGWKTLTWASEQIYNYMVQTIPCEPSLVEPTSYLCDDQVDITDENSPTEDFGPEWDLELGEEFISYSIFDAENDIDPW